MAKHFKAVHFYLQCDKCFFVGLSNIAMKKHESDKHSLPDMNNDPVFIKSEPDIISDCSSGIEKKNAEFERTLQIELEEEKKKKYTTIKHESEKHSLPNMNNETVFIKSEPDIENILSNGIEKKNAEFERSLELNKPTSKRIREDLEITDSPKQNLTLRDRILAESAEFAEYERSLGLNISVRKRSKKDLEITDSPKQIKEHIESAHEEKKLFKCAICDYSSAIKGNMNKHVASVHEGKKPFHCDICDYSCSLKKDLNKHVASVHEGKKPFQCNICDASFVSKQSINEHIASVHEGKKHFKCPICDASFAKKHNLKVHMASVHEGKKIEMQDKILAESGRKSSFRPSGRPSKEIMPGKPHKLKLVKTPSKCSGCNFSTDDQQAMKKHESDKHSLPAMNNETVFIKCEPDIKNDFSSGKEKKNAEFERSLVLSKPTQKIIREDLEMTDSPKQNLELRDRIMAESRRISKVKPPGRPREILMPEKPLKIKLVETPERPVSKLCYQYGRKKTIENQEFIITEIDDSSKATSSKYSRKSEDPLALEEDHRAKEIRITNEDRDKALESLGETPFTCQKCNKNFATERGLKQHEMKGN